MQIDPSLNYTWLSLWVLFFLCFGYLYFQQLLNSPNRFLFCHLLFQTRCDGWVWLHFILWRQRRKLLENHLHFIVWVIFVQDENLFNGDFYIAAWITWGWYSAFKITLWHCFQTQTRSIDVNAISSMTSLQVYLLSHIFYWHCTMRLMQWVYNNTESH